jgi:hypothetical protein
MFDLCEASHDGFFYEKPFKITCGDSCWFFCEKPFKITYGDS